MEANYFPTVFINNGDNYKNINEGFCLASIDNPVGKCKHTCNESYFYNGPGS